MVITETAYKSEITADVNEILRYLGYGKSGATEDVLNIIKKCLAEMDAVVSFKACYKKFPLTSQNGFLEFGGMKISSKSLEKNLNGCRYVIAFAATIGIMADRVIKKHSALSSSFALVADATGTAYIEAWCDLLCERFKAMEKGSFLRPRFSPGYGDFSINCQPMLLNALDAPRKVGISLTDGLLMVPSKSVSAIIGVSDFDAGCTAQGCEACDNKGCEFRRS